MLAAVCLILQSNAVSRPLQITVSERTTRDAIVKELHQQLSEIKNSELDQARRKSLEKMRSIQSLLASFEEQVEW